MRAALLDLPDGEGSFEDFCNNAGSALYVGVAVSPKHRQYGISMMVTPKKQDFVPDAC